MSDVRGTVPLACGGAAEKEKGEDGKPVSEIYGAEHLLRLFGTPCCMQCGRSVHVRMAAPWLVHRNTAFSFHDHGPLAIAVSCSQVAESAVGLQSGALGLPHAAVAAAGVPEVSYRGPGAVPCLLFGAAVSTGR